MKHDDNMEKPNSSSVKARNNKENINSNNVEVPKLGMEPMQMKRRKKGGGYNMRKSLAWDRAFFTDEGILDPLELTLITGINANTCGGGLPTISEEASEEVLRKLDEKCTSMGNREKAGCSEGNHDSLSHHKVAQKILPIDHTTRAGSSVGGCSVPLAASLLKRPGNTTTLKAANKESKLPKLHISKPGSCFSAMTKGSMSASQSKHTLVPKPTINVKKNDVLKSSVKNVHVSHSKAKTGSGDCLLPVKERGQKTVRNMTNSLSKATSSTKSRVLVDKANCGAERVSNRLQLHELQGGSASLASKNLVQHPATHLNNPFPATSSLEPCHIQRVSSGLMSDKLLPCESKHSYTGAYPPKIQNAKPSGLRLPSPSLRFFDQEADPESGSLQREKVRQYTTNMGSNRKNSELKPPVAPANILGNVCSAPSTLGIYNDLGNTVGGVTGSELDVHKVIEQDRNILGHEDDMEMEKNARKGDMDKKMSYPTEQLGEENGANIHLAGNVRCNNNIGVGTRQPMPRGQNVRVTVPETEGIFVLHNQDDILPNHIAILMSASGQSIQHQEHNILNAFDGSANFMQVFAQTSREQADTEISDAHNVNPESHLDANSLKAEDQGSEVFVESRKDAIGKREDDIGASKWDSPCLESNSIVLQSENIGQENDVAKLVNEVCRRSPVEDNAGCYTGSPRSKKGRISIIFQNGGNIDAMDLKGTITRMDTSHIPFRDINNEQGNGDAEIQLEFREHHLIDGYNHCNLSNPKPEVDLIISGTPSLDDDALLKTETVLEVARCASTYPESLEKVGVATTELESKIHEENQKSQEMGMFIVNMSGKSIEEANPIIQGSTGGLETYNQFQSKNQTLEVSGTIGNFPEMHLEDAQVRLSDDDTLVRSCSSLTAILQNSSIGNVDHNDIFEEQSEFSDTDKLEQDSKSICQLLSNTDNVQQESVCKVVSCMDYCSAGVESCSFQRKVADSITEEMPILFWESFDIGQGSANNERFFMGRLSPEKIADLETPISASDSVIDVPEQSISHGSDLQDSNGGAQTLPMVQGNTSDFNEQSGYFMESSGQGPLESNSKFPVSQHPTTGGKSPSTIFCSVSGELCSDSGREKSLQTSTFSVGHEGSKMSLGKELETEVLLKIPMVAEFHHELDSESDLKNNKDATALTNRSNSIKRQDNSLIIHPPNAVPFSDEWLAAIEAAGEEILTMKCGAVQHSPPDKSLPEPSPWSPVKKKASHIGPYDCTKYTNILPPNPH